MGIVEEIEAVLDLANRPANVVTLVVVPDGEDMAIVRCDPPGHWAGPHVLGQEVTPALEAAGFEVERAEQPLVGGVLFRPRQQQTMVPILRVGRPD